MDIKTEVTKQFNDDYLYLYLKKQGFNEQQLLPDFLNDINPAASYSTIEVAKMLNVSDNDLRYNIKIMRSIGYLKSIKVGRNHRFNYVQCYQLFLVVTILNLSHHTTTDIKNIIEENENKSFVTTHSTINTTNSVELLKLQYEITVIEQKINAEFRSYIQLDNKLNLALIENKYEIEIIKLNSMHSKSRWFSKNANNQSSQLTPTIDLMNLKEQVLDAKAKISDYEIELMLKTQALKQTIDHTNKLKS